MYKCLEELLFKTAGGDLELVRIHLLHRLLSVDNNYGNDNVSRLSASARSV